MAMQGSGGDVGGAPTAEAIIEWLQQEMGCRASPSEDALRRICRGNMMLVWKFLLDRVKSDQTVEKIRRNIHVHGSAEKRELNEERENEEEKEVEAGRIEKLIPGKSVRRRGDLIKSRSRSRTGGRPKSKEGVLGERENVAVSEDSIEKALRERDAAEKEVEKLRLSLQCMEKDLKSRMLDGSREESERQRVSEEKINLRYQYENNRVLEGVSADVEVLLNVHSRNPRGSSKEVKNTFKHLRERQKAHAHQFMATEDALNQAAEAKRRTDELVSRIYDVDRDTSALSTGPLRKHELEVWAKERELAGVRASVITLTAEVQRLHKLREEQRIAEEIVCQKWKRIEEFDCRRMGLEAAYTALLHANIAAAAAWEHHSRASREQSACTIIPVCESLQNQSNAARDLIEREIFSFQRCPDNLLYMLPAFPQGLIEGTMAVNASGAEAFAAAERSADFLTARAASGDPFAIPSLCRISGATHYSCGEGGDFGLGQIVDSLRFFLRPGGTSANLIEDLAQVVNQVQTLKDLLNRGRGLLAAAGASIPDYERSVTYCAVKTAEEDKIAVERWLPELKTAVQEAERCLEDCKRVLGLVDEWWEQPASTVVDWVSVDGRNVGAWVALVKQLQTTFYEKQLL